ncbi:MAG: carbamoyltransferase HypF [bacterium]
MDRLVEIGNGEKEVAPDEIVRVKIAISGIVQGVGFRPFVFRLATQCGLGGYVLNDPDGVEVEIEGEIEKINEFLVSLTRQKPPVSRIDSIRVSFVDPLDEKVFSIRESKGKSRRTVLISPDIATCQDCIDEILDPSNRRFRYPFTNCTNCGPRYTIIRDIPYDRVNTTMDVFAMCDDCIAEYRDPLNRRFHAEPNACWKCGPRVVLRDGSGNVIETDDPIEKAIRLLSQGKVVAVKGLGGFHLAVDACSEEAVQTLRLRKRREMKPLAIMVRDVAKAEEFVLISDEEKRVLLESARPIVLLRKREGCAIAESVAPNNRRLGIMLPYTPVHHLLLQRGPSALVMTSGNVSEEPIAIDLEDSLRRLGGIADYYLDHNREILNRCDDSVVRVFNGDRIFLRRSRGWVPLPITIDESPPPILACGADLKNTIAVTRGNQVFLSQHIGDLEDFETSVFFQNTVNHLSKILEVQPRIVVHDLHPDYFSTRFAKAFSADVRIGVQHHHAHIASCLGEKGIEGHVIGFALDGTGYGEDGTIWGGEVLIADRSGYQRIGHLEQVVIPGGEVAIRNPWRMALAHLWNAFGSGIDIEEISRILRIENSELEIVLSIIRKGLNSPYTSSCGRLFDAVSNLCGLCDKVLYEGQAAVELEMVADTSIRDAYGVDIEPGEKMILGTKGLIKAVLDDLRKGESAGVISMKFHNWLVEAISSIAIQARTRTGIKTVAISGGCFQNEILLYSVVENLRKNGFEVIYNTLVPPNDGGIAFGQVIVACEKLSGGSGDVSGDTSFGD